MKKIILLILCFYIFGPLFSQNASSSCYERRLKEGRDLFEKQQYKDAKTVFENAKSQNCHGKPADGIKVLDSWIKKCNTKINEEPKTVKLQFTTDYPCTLCINGQNQGTMEVGKNKEVSLTYKPPKQTFSIVASSITDTSIKYKNEITISGTKKTGIIPVKLKNLMPKKEEIKNVEKEEKIEQEITLEISISNLDFANTGGTTTVKVNTNADNYWIVDSTLPEYCSIVRKQSSFFDIKCNSNPDPEDRTGWFIVKAGNKEKRIDIKQKASPVYLTISSKDIHLGDAGGAETITIKTNARNLKINEIDSFKADWITITKIASDSFKIECENNPSVEDRITRYGITAEGIEDTIVIQQNGKQITNIVYPYNAVFNSKGGTRSISVTTTTGEYGISTSPKWYSIGNKNKTGFVVNCEPYTKKEIRYARTDRKLKKNLTRYDTIIVSVKDSIQKVSVAQKAPAMALKIPYNTIGFSFGYVYKNWDYQIPNDTAELVAWNNTKNMHGLQVGIRVEPYFASWVFGLGISTGLYYQYATSKIPKLNDVTYGNYKKTMKEHSLYFPIHLIYRYDFTKTVGIFINGGIAIDWSLSLELNSTTESIVYTYTNPILDKFSDWKTSSKTTVTGELGGGIKLGRFIFSITSSVGSSKETVEDNADTFKIIPKYRMRVGLTLMLQ
jgi:hypothetical protein